MALGVQGCSRQLRGGSFALQSGFVEQPGREAIDTIIKYVAKTSFCF
jgi:hypothetical protein